MILAISNSRTSQQINIGTYQNHNRFSVVVVALLGLLVEGGEVAR
jgi:hypothetical protein